MDWSFIVGVGLSVEAVVSCLWSFVEKYYLPKEVCFIYTSVTKRFRDVLKDVIKTFSPTISIKDIVVDETDIESIVERVGSVIDEYRSRNYKVCIDVTPGRKTMSIALYYAGLKKNVDRIVYLHLKDRMFEKEIYPFIPKPCIDLVTLHGD